MSRSVLATVGPLFGLTGPFMLAGLYDREKGKTGGAVLLSTLLSLATIPAAVALLGA